jgi:hypothetical protein
MTVTWKLQQQAKPNAKDKDLYMELDYLLQS